MTKNVTVTMHALHRGVTEMDAMPVEVKADGIYRFVNNRHHISFMEALDGGSKAQTRDHIAIGENSVDVHKTGQAVTDMHFEMGKRTPLDYETRFGRLRLETDTKKLYVDAAEDRIRVEIQYAIYSAGKHASDCVMQIEVVPAK
ncbi:MAG: DUF1934 domain-containing protein [Eubacteriales bacterium]